MTAGASPSGVESGVGAGGEFVEGVGVREFSEAGAHRRSPILLGQLCCHLGESALCTVEVGPREGTHEFVASVADD